MMRKCCSLDLHLSPSSTLMGDCTAKANKEDRIFNNGKNCVFDLTELQARAIIWKANEDIMKERVERGCPPIVATGSLKRSLQRFLQKRKMRVQSTSPYNTN